MEVIMEAVQMPDQLRDLVSELHRQAEECIRSISPSEKQETVIEGLFTLQNEGADYAHSLRELQTSIKDCLTNARDWRAIQIPTESLLWKFCAFSRPSQLFVDPTIMRKKVGTFLRGVDRQSHSDNIHKFWETKAVDQWITSDKPSSIFLEAQLGTSRVVRRFSLDLVEHLEKYHPVIYMVGGLSQSEADVFFPDLTPEIVLENLIIQAIRHLSPEQPMEFLAETLQALNTSTTSVDFLNLLHRVCSNIPKLSIIVDLSMLYPRFEQHITEWPARLSQIVMDLWELSCPRFCQVMMLGARRLFSEHHESGPLVSSNNMTERRCRPLLQSLRKPEPTVFDPPSGLKPSHNDVLVSRQSPGGLMSFLQESQSSQSINVASTAISEDTNLGLHFFQAGRMPEQPDRELPHREQIELVIICALTIESNAVEALFDDHWENLDQKQMRSPGETNAYTFGRFGRFPTVLVHMPGMGKANATHVGTNCRHSFPNVKFTLVVGICGGVPFNQQDKTEVLLGDVVISEQLVVYDYGRQYPDCFLRKTSVWDVPGRPSAEIRGLLVMLKDRRGRRKLQERTAAYLEALKRELGDDMNYPGPEKDELFEGSYLHRHSYPDICAICSDDRICDKARGMSCEELSCDKSKLVSRSRLKAVTRDGGAFQPVVHFGYFACGDQVMKSGNHRDTIAKNEEVIAFEMEGAGVWDTFPCLVIKAVCDYADSHKHKMWQNLAAGTAAACTKALLQEWYM